MPLGSSNEMLRIVMTLAVTSSVFSSAPAVLVVSRVLVRLIVPLVKLSAALTDKVMMSPAGI